jgi:hypothetical protein
LCVIRGFATRFDSDGPVELQAWRLTDDVPTAKVAETAVANGAQSYALSVPPDGRYAVLATANDDLPQTRVLFTYGAFDAWLPPIQLDKGWTFSGTVDLAYHTSGRRTWVYLSRLHPVLRREFFTSQDFLSVREAFEHDDVATETDDQGHFAFEGLAPGAYEMRLGIDREVWTQLDPVTHVEVPPRM